MKRKFYWNEETHTALCEYYYKNSVFTGIATCHPEDIDFASEITGMTIAEHRATIKYYQHIKNNEIMPMITTYKHILGMYHDRPIDDTYYVIKRQLKYSEEDLAYMRTLIQAEKDELKYYIDAKDVFYKKIRATKKAKEN